MAETRTRQPRYAQIFKDDERAEIAAQVWQETKQFLEDNELLTPRRLAIADRYARAYAEYEQLHPVAMEEGAVTVGPNGGDVFNFKWSVVEKLNERIAKFETALLITPHAAGGAVKDKKPDAPKKTPADEFLAPRPN